MKLSQEIVEYLQTNTRVEARLRILAMRLYHTRNPKASIFNAISSKSKMSKVFQEFKILMLMHHCFLQDVLNDDNILQILDGLHSIPSQDIFQTMLDGKINKPYKLYLQKRIMGENHTFMNKQQKVYQYLNLLSRGSTFSDFLFIFGRYYRQKYEFSIDLNILLGKDLRKLYTLLHKQLTILPYNQAINLQLQKIHQKLYIVYYNCYFYQYMTNYIPKWFNTDPTHKQIENKSMMSISTNANSRCSDHQIEEEVATKKMSQSALIQSSFHDKKVSEFEITQLGLLKSMERVIQSMDQ